MKRGAPDRYKPVRAFQKLPRHLRRRTMSHNPYRIHSKALRQKVTPSSGFETHLLVGFCGNGFFRKHALQKFQEAIQKAKEKSEHALQRFWKKTNRFSFNSLNRI